MFNSIGIRKNPALLLTATLAVVIILLLLTRTVSAAQGGNSDSNNQGNTQVLAQIAQMQQQITDLQTNISAQLDALGTQINVHDSDVESLVSTETQDIDSAIDDLSTQLGDHDADVGDQISAETLEIDTILAVIDETTDGHANPSPFTVTANTCATFGGGASVGGELSGGMELGASGSIGAEAAGNGVKAKSNLQGSLMAKLALQGGVDIVHSVCNSGLYVTSDAKEEDDYTDHQQSIIDDYGNAAYALQSQNEGFGGLLASNLDAPQDVFSLASQMGLNISDIVPSLNALIDLDGLPDNPAALVTGDSGLNDFLDVFDFAESVDTSGMLDAFTDPCASLSGLGSTAAAICDDPTPSFEAALAELQGTVDGIETVIGEVDAAIDGAITATLNGIQSTVNGIDQVVDDIEDATDDIERTVSTIDRHLDDFCEMTDDIGYLLDWFLDRDINCPF